MQQDGKAMDRTVRRRGRATIWVVVFGLGTICAFASPWIYRSFIRWATADRSLDLSHIRVAKAERGDLVRDVSVQGRIVAAEQPTLVSPALGVISLNVKAGDVLRKGDLMARIVSPEVQNRLKQEEAASLSMQSEIERLKIASKQADLQNRQQVSLLELKLKAGEKAAERARRLFEEGLGNSIDYEKAQDDVEVLKLELAHMRERTRLAREVADFEIRTKEIELDRQRLKVSDLERQVAELSVVSPVAGLVARVEVKDKDTVPPNKPLFSVVDLSKYEVEVLIPENFAPEIDPGTEAAVQHEGREYPAEVKSISPEVESSQVKGVVVFKGTGPPGLKQNQRVSTRMIFDTRKNVVKVPRGPFLESLGGRQVYVVEEGVAALRPIRVGAISVTEIEILSGLEPGEEIVLSDLTRFEGAARILLRD